MERFGYDPDTAPFWQTARSVYYLMAERTRSEYGLVLRLAGEIPAVDPCEPMSDDERTEYRKGIAEKRRQILCASDRLTTIEELDEWLVSSHG